MQPIREYAVNNFWAVSSMILILFSMVCAPPVKEDPIKMLSSDDLFDNKRAIVSLYMMGKSAIPKLIEKIDDSNIVLFDLGDPTSSSWQKEDTEKRLGSIAAYLIEWILAIDDINLDDIMESPFFLGNDIENYIYPVGSIVIEERRVSAGDLVVVKGLYEDWWRRNSAKELSELRLEWRQGIRPLSGTVFSWE